MVVKPRRRAASTLLVVALVLIALTTLLPASNFVPTPQFCVFCGALGGIDFTLNVILFVPLGLALRWLTGRWTTALIIGGATTLLIETLQWRVVPGRDASLGDLIANMLGTMLGAWLAVGGARLLQAPPATARALSAVASAATAVIIGLSAALLQPIDPIGAQYVQWAPERPDMDVFRGKLVVAQLNGRLLIPLDPFPSQWVYDSVTRAMALRAVLRTPVPPSERQAIIVRIANEEYEGFMLAQRGDAAVFRSTMGAIRLKLRPILVGLPHALKGSTTSDSVLMLHGNSNPRAISLIREQSSGKTEASLRRTVGLAWAMLLPWDIALTSRWWPANTLWLALLVFPVTLLTTRSIRKPAAGTSPGIEWWPLLLVLVTLLVAPALTDLSLPGPGDWLGVVTGAAAGVLGERAAAVSLSNGMSSEAAPTMHS